MSVNTHHTRIKICGFTRVSDALAAVELGADAIGMVFYPNSDRYIYLTQAKAIAAALPPFVSRVALFVNAEPEFVKTIAAAVKPDYLQFHGDESEPYCKSFAIPYIKAFRVGAPGMDDAVSLATACQGFNSAAAWLFDSYTPAYGGSGQSFADAMLDQIPRSNGSPALILSGGLNSATVASRIEYHRPYAVDVSSAVEFEPGQKDPEKMQAFIKAVHNTDSIVK